MRVILFPSTLSVEQVQSIMTPLRQVQLCGIIAIGESQYADWKRKAPHVPSWELRNISDLSDQKPETNLHDSHENIVDKLLQDSRIYYLLEEEQSFYKVSNVFNSMKVLDTICWNSLWILAQTKPDKVVIGSTPHCLVSYVFCKTAEQLDIPVFSHRPMAT